MIASEELRRRERSLREQPIQRICAAAQDRVPGGAQLRSHTAASKATDGNANVADSALLLMERLTPRERAEVLPEIVRGQAAAVLRLSPAKALHKTQRLMDVAVDSLMAVELAGRLSAGPGGECALRSTLIFDRPTIQAIAEYIEQFVLGMARWQRAPQRRPQLPPDADLAKLKELR
jgi:hypothetical protein